MNSSLSQLSRQDGCTHEFTVAVEAPPPHFMKLQCSSCGAFRGWVMDPKNVERRRFNKFRIGWLLAKAPLTSWEKTFLESVETQKKLSPRQVEVLDRLYEKNNGTNTTTT
jgi:hypothetical protein